MTKTHNCGINYSEKTSISGETFNIRTKVKGGTYMNGKVNISEMEEELAIHQVVNVIVEDNIAYILDEIKAQNEVLHENGKIHLWTKDTTPSNLIITPAVEKLLKRLSSNATAIAYDMAYNEVEKSLAKHGCILTNQGNETWLEIA